MSLISANFSFTRHVANFIEEQRKSEAENGALRFAQQALVTRVAALSLSIFATIDFSAHTLGVISSAFYSTYKGLVSEEPLNYSSSIQHLKCMSAFIREILFASTIGFIFPVPSGFMVYECTRVKNACGLLLSRDRNYFNSSEGDVSLDRSINSLSFLKYFRSLVEEMKPEELVGMGETLGLLKGAEETHKELCKLDHQKILDTGLSPWLAKITLNLRGREATLFEQIFFKEFLGRLFALTLSVGCAVDVVYRSLILSLFIAEMLLLDQFMGERTFQGDPKEMFLFVCYHFRDVFLSLMGTLTSSVVSVVSPEWGSALADPTSEFNSQIRWSIQEVKERKHKALEKLEEGKSLLIPVSFDVAPELYVNEAGEEKIFGGNGGHIVYCLIKKVKQAKNKEEGSSYSVTIINKGWGSETTMMALKMGVDEKGRAPVNCTFKDVSEETAKQYLSDLIDLNVSSKEILEEHKKKEEGKFPNRPITLKLYGLNLDKDKGNLFNRPTRENVLFTKLSVTGDCPKASLLGALRYHSASQSQNDRLDSIPYKIFMNHLKKRALDREGHLLDIALGIPKHDATPSEAVQARISVQQAKLPKAAG